MDTISSSHTEEASTKGRYDNPYNDEPVYYCKRCLSLKVRDVPSVSNSDYCDECGSGDIGICSIQEYEEMYFKKFGHYYIDNF